MTIAKVLSALATATTALAIVASSSYSWRSISVEPLIEQKAAAVVLLSVLSGPLSTTDIILVGQYVN